MRLFQANDGTVRFAVAAQGVKPNASGETYSLWFSKKDGGAQLLGDVKDPVGEKGELTSAGPSNDDVDEFPQWFTEYDSILVTLDGKNAKEPGKVILSGDLPSSSVTGAAHRRPQPDDRPDVAARRAAARRGPASRRRRRHAGRQRPQRRPRRPAAARAGVARRLHPRLHRPRGGGDDRRGGRDAAGRAGAGRDPLDRDRARAGRAGDRPQRARAELPDGGWVALEAVIDDALADHGVLVCSGSLPPGAPENGYALLVARARDAGQRSVVDAAGPALAAALHALSRRGRAQPRRGRRRALRARRRGRRRRPGREAPRQPAALELVRRGAEAAVVTAAAAGAPSCGTTSRCGSTRRA